MSNVLHRPMCEHLVPRLFDEIIKCLGGESQGMDFENVKPLPPTVHPLLSVSG